MNNIRRISTPVIVSMLLLLMTACTGAKESANDHARHLLPNGDLQETTASVSELPSFLEQQPEIVAQIYQIAAAHADLLASIPCYCGCGDSAGHRHNMNCFIHEIKDDGAVVWDDHGTRCNVCLEIAVKSAEMKQQGKSTRDIRETIDDMYKKGYAKPTPTPMPAA